MDRFNLLTEVKDEVHTEELSDEDLLVALCEVKSADIDRLIHVKSEETKREAEAAEYIADRVKCEDFDRYRFPV